MRVFVSYRRGDAGGYAGRLADALGQRLGARSVFQDVSAISPGRDFTEAIDGALDDCDAVLAVIGPGWLGATDTRGARRLFEADDYVRLELTRALSRRVTVVPVLVGGAALPAPAELPDDLAELSRRQAVTLHDATWHDDVDGLVRSLRGEPTGPPGGRRRTPLLAGTAVVIVLALVAGIWWWRAGSPGDDAEAAAAAEAEEEAAELPPCPPASGQGWTGVRVGPTAVSADSRRAYLSTFRVEAASQRSQGSNRWEVSLDLEVANGTPLPQYNGIWLYDHLSVARRAFDPVCFTADPELVESGNWGKGRIGFEVDCEPVGYLGLVLSDGATIDVTDSSDPPSC